MQCSLFSCGEEAEAVFGGYSYCDEHLEDLTYFVEDMRGWSGDHVYAVLDLTDTALSDIVSRTKRPAEKDFSWKESSTWMWVVKEIASRYRRQPTISSGDMSEYAIELWLKENA